MQLGVYCFTDTALIAGDFLWLVSLHKFLRKINLHNTLPRRKNVVNYKVLCIAQGDHYETAAG